MKASIIWLMTVIGIYQCAIFCPLRCKCKNTFVNCTYLSLKTVPGNISFDTTHLDLSFNLIKNLLANSFKDLKKLKLLKLSSNDMKTIDENAFIGLSSLKRLYLTNNDLSVLKPETFNKNLNSLLHVYLSNNEFESIPVLKATHMTKLNLDNNKIRKAFISESFLLNSQLQTLVLSLNEIKEIKNGDFANLKNTQLKTLNLKMNKLENISPETFVPVKNSLFNLELKGNRLLNSTIIEKSLVGFTGSTGMLYLDLRECGLQSISKDFFKPFFQSKLQHLDLSGNPMLETIDNDSFRELDKLQILDLAKCKIDNSNIRFSALKGLKSLFFSKNNLINCPHRLPASLEVIDLQSNDIRKIQKYDFKSLTNLKQLYLQNNKILSIEIDSFSDLTSLTNLNLGLNRLAKIETGIFNRMPKLVSLNLAKQNPSLSEIGRDSLVLTGLKSLELQENQIKLNRGASGALFDKMPELRNLSLKDNKLNELNEEMFVGTKNLEFIDLSMNNLIGWSSQTFVPLVSSVIDIQLSMNKISFISIDNKLKNYLPIKFERLRNIHLENNQWNCSCQHINWLLHFRELIPNHDKILCQYPNEKSGKNLISTMSNCSYKIRVNQIVSILKSSSLTGIVVFVVVAVIMIILVIFIWKFRNSLKSKLFKAYPSYRVLHNSNSFANPLESDFINHDEAQNLNGGALCFQYADLTDSQPSWQAQLSKESDSDFNFDYNLDVLFVSNKQDLKKNEKNQIIVKKIDNLISYEVKRQVYHCTVLAIDISFDDIETLKEILKIRIKNFTEKINYVLYKTDESIEEFNLFPNCKYKRYNSEITEEEFYDMININSGFSFNYK